MALPATSLHSLLETSASICGDKVAVVDPGVGTMTYGELAVGSDALRDRLARLGVQPGERVGIWLQKSLDSIVSVFGILKAGAAYVPVDPDAPPARCAYIFGDCAVRAVICDARLEGALREELGRLGALPHLLVLPDAPQEARLAAFLRDEQRRDPAPVVATLHPEPDGIAYVLYTSGSTGRPKGVTISHRAARCFVDWCSSTFEPHAEDVFSSHAPLHFDLSIHDIYVSLRHGATLVLVGEEAGKDPLGLAALISGQAITIWYSTPSILGLLAQYGKLERHEYPKLRIVHFAGEVFPMPAFRALHARWPDPRYFNLYGPTETNVCTYHEVRAIDVDRKDPFPIGQLCAHYQGRVVDGDGRDVPAGEEGELLIAGPGVMTGYWNLPEQNARVFVVDGEGTSWYRTGDLVRETLDAGYVFHGRRDRMVKRRGYRVELGEIEAVLATHADLREVAVIALQAQDSSVRIKAFVSPHAGKRLSVIELKRFSAENLPKYMVPDAFESLEALPRTSTDKTDYQSLKARG